jgi:hypothetical protein
MMHDDWIERDDTARGMQMLAAALLLAAPALVVIAIAVLA